MVSEPRQNWVFELRTGSDRKRAFEELRKLILDDVASGRLPTFHVVRVDSDGTVTNHYMTPVSLEPIDDRGSIGVWVQDYEFFLKLFLKLRKVVEVEYDPKRPAVIFIYVEG